MSKLLIDPELLRQCRAEADALPDLPLLADPNNNPGLDDVMPAKVRAFFEHQEADTPAWRLESAEERAVRQEAAERGAWAG